MLVNIAGFLYPFDFMIIERSDMHMPIILGSPFLATAKAQIDYGENTIRIKKGKKAVSFPTVPRHVRNVSLRKKMEATPNTLHSNVQEKVLAWEAKIKNYNESTTSKRKDEKEDSTKGDKLTSDPLRFKVGDSVLLRHLDTEERKASPWWYGPFTIRNFTSKGAASLIRKRGVVVTGSIERLGHRPLITRSISIKDM